MVISWLRVLCTGNLNYQWEVCLLLKVLSCGSTFVTKEDCLLLTFHSVPGFKIFFSWFLPMKVTVALICGVVWTDTHQILTWNHLQESQYPPEITKWLVFYLVSSWYIINGELFITKDQSLPNAGVMECRILCHLQAYPGVCSSAKGNPHD